MCPQSRGHFKDVEEMNETIISNWNECISRGDEVLHFGDFFMGQIDDILPILKRLNGHITLIRGNHDYGKRRRVYQDRYITIKDIDYINYRGKYFICSHIPIGNRECMEHLIGPNQEIWNLHGHTHQTTFFSDIPNAFHVGIDSNNLKPISLEEVWRKIVEYEANCLA